MQQFQLSDEVVHYQGSPSHLLDMTPNINTLPPEIIMLILESLPTSAALLAAILSCRHVHNLVKPTSFQSSPQ
ncbi:hypothetical protein BDW74DRAFT_164394 [Aspergillus multicolor]|uniref:uncharacterized protein n=1 Tax=Aspergillus multicolor TaxID=41759 RepID=UPI003CCCF713